MGHVFIRIVEGEKEEEKVQTCQLLSGESAQAFLSSPAKYLREFNNAVLLDSWTVPEDLENATASNSVCEAFEALLALDVLSEFPVVSDLYATIFEAGYRLAASKKNA